MCAGHKAGLFRHSGNAVVGLFDQVLGGLDANAVDILNQTQINGLFEEPAQVIGTDIELIGNVGQGQLFGVMLGNVTLDLTDNAVGHPAVVSAHFMLGFAHFLELKQQRCQQHFLECLPLGGRVLLRLYELLKDRINVILLLDGDVAEQMIVLVTQETEKVQLGETVADFLEVIGAEIADDSVGGGVPHRTGFVNLVFPDQNHAACVDDVSGVLNEIAACSLHLIINFVFVVDVES